MARTLTKDLGEQFNWQELQLLAMPGTTGLFLTKEVFFEEKRPRKFSPKYNGLTQKCNVLTKMGVCYDQPKDIIGEAKDSKNYSGNCEAYKKPMRNTIN